MCWWNANAQKLLSSYFRLSQFDLDPLHSEHDVANCLAFLSESVEDLRGEHVAVRDAIRQVVTFAEEGLVHWCPEYGCAVVSVPGTGECKQYCVYVIGLDSWEFNIHLSASGKREFDSKSGQYRKLLAGEGDQSVCTRCVCGRHSRP